MRYKKRRKFHRIIIDFTLWKSDLKDSNILRKKHQTIIDKHANAVVTPRLAK